MSVKASENTNEDDMDRDEDSAVGGNPVKIMKKLISKGKEVGHITYDELNKALPAGQYTSEQIDDTMAMLSDLGINLVEAADVDDDDDDEDEVEETTSKKGKKSKKGKGEDGEAGNLANKDLGRTDDPVRMYLREMGSVELLSREGEIAIAKRIEAGRDVMIGGICESPLTIQALIAWHKALENEQVLLREIIDLEGTYDQDDNSSKKSDDEKPSKSDSKSDSDSDEDDENEEDEDESED